MPSTSRVYSGLSGLGGLSGRGGQDIFLEINRFIAAVKNL